MPNSEKAIVVMPAYNASQTLESVLADIPLDCVDEILLVDDCSQDDTVEKARSLGLTVIEHDQNKGYGGNQKTCYLTALQRDADYVVMLHPDDQYDARVIRAALDIIRIGNCDVVLGNRIRTRHEALSGGMPLVKYLSNRGLTIVENMLSGQNLGEWHSGFRAYSRRVLEVVPFQRNSDNFVFDSQFLVQCVHFGFRIGDVPIPVRYFEEASQISIRNSSVYAMSTLWTFARWFGHRWRLRRDPLFEPARSLDPPRPLDVT
jgi:glycosyltransferase involved in cell wall biosynthesis